MIGGGSGDIAAARRATEYGARVGLADLQDWWQLWQEQQGQVLAALVAHLGQPLDSWDPPLVTQVQRLGRQHLTTLQEDLPGLNSLADIAAWCEQTKSRP